MPESVECARITIQVALTARWPDVAVSRGTDVMNRLLLLLLAVPLGSFAQVASAPERLPSYLTVPPTLHPANDQSVTFEPYGEAEIDTHASDQPLLVMGKHWHANLVLDHPPQTDDPRAIWAAIKPALVQGGWTVTDEYTSSGVVRYQKSGKDVRAEFSFGNGSDSIQVELIEVAPPSVTLTLAPPAATPERLSTAVGDIPYLTKLPGSDGGAGVQDDTPMTVRLPDSDEDDLVGSGSLTKKYTSPPGLSTLAFATAYRDALARASWTIVSVGQGPHQADASVLAHYTKNGRDIWAYIHDDGSGYAIQVADAGRSCRAARQGLPRRPLRRVVRLQQVDAEAGIGLHPAAGSGAAAEDSGAHAGSPGPHRQRRRRRLQSDALRDARQIGDGVADGAWRRTRAAERQGLRQDKACRDQRHRRRPSQEPSRRNRQARMSAALSQAPGRACFRIKTDSSHSISHISQTASA